MERLERRIERFLLTSEGDFDALALELFRRQFEKNGPYQAFCQAQGRSPTTVARWEEIPAVPIRAFKSAHLAAFPVSQAAAVFHSSATMTGVPSRHYLKDMRYYETSLKTSFAEWVVNGPHPRLPCPRPFFILTPAPAEASRSSLAWMMEVVRRQWGAAGSDFFVQRGRLDEPRLTRALTKAQQAGQAVTLLGTTLAFLAFFDYCGKAGRRFQLPDGSRLMDTGGMKTNRREASRSDFIDQVQEWLGLPESACLNEYGMCELSSQFYGRGRSPRLQGPPWVRTRVIDLTTGEPAANGKPGLLCHFDLANVDSVMAIQTDDIGVASPPTPRPAGGADTFSFLGRAPEAEIKGCSLYADAFFR